MFLQNQIVIDLNLICFFLRRYKVSFLNGYKLLLRNLWILIPLSIPSNTRLAWKENYKGQNL